MRKFTTTVLAGVAAGVLAIATIAAMSQPARAAAGTYTPHGGPLVTLSGHDVTFTHVDSGFSYTCPQLDMSGSLFEPSQSRPFGTPATTWEDLTTSGCTTSMGDDVTVDLTGTWGFAVTEAEVGSVSPAAITDAAMFVGTSGCSFSVAGEITGAFDDSTGVFTPDGSTQIISDDPAGFLCPILGIARGQAMDVDGSWTITGLTITNP